MNSAMKAWTATPTLNDSGPLKRLVWKLPDSNSKFLVTPSAGVAASVLRGRPGLPGDDLVHCLRRRYDRTALLV